MWNLDVVIDAGMPVVWQFLFKNKSAAEEMSATLARGQINQREFPRAEAWVTLRDEYGSTADIRCLTIKGWRLTDMEADQGGQVERAINQQQAVARAQTLIQSDPKLNGANRLVTMPPGMMPGRMA
ncbi:MAG: hypothetical protein C5B50_00645 [Verrucomicrobia bacterium]|nr:MAG: hypothetical protein C5B50_00645 [Verrucomicrobiota bacterium]